MDRRIGRYEIQEELGRGAFGRVYRAFDPSVKRAVAIKILASESSPEILERFRAEAGTTGNLTHNNIVTVYEYAEHEGMPYLAMELLEGRTLQKLIDEHEPLTLLEKVDIMSQIAEGLAAAHDRGVIHRDIKPGNIMVLPSGTAKIMDFGIARVMDRDSTRRTRQGDLVGTILYMSPEQFQGLDPDRLSDVFAYGVMFYELLTGEHPFSRYPFPVSDVGTVMYRITTAEPPPLREKAPDCPEALEHLVQRIMAKDREIRARGFEEILIDSAPVLHELKSIRAHQLMDGLGGLIEAGKIDAAQAQIRQVLELDPFNTEARRWRRELQEKADQALVKTKVDGLLREGDAHMAARRFQQAVQSYEASVHADKSNAGAKDRLERAKAALEVSRKVSRGLSEARWEMQQGRLDAAAAKVSEALAADPHNTEAARLRETIERQVTEARWEALLAKAEDERSRQAYGDALQTLSEIAAEPAIAGRVEMARESIEAERAEFERKRRAARLQTGLAQTRQALQAQRLEEAEASAEALAAEFPGEEAPRAQLNEVRELQAARRRAAAIGELTQAARGLIEAKRFDEAVGALEGGIGQYRDAGLQRLLETALSLKADHQRALGIAGAIEHAQQLRQAGEFEKALDLLRQSANNFGADPGLDDCRRQIQREKDQRDRAAARERAIADIRHLAGGQRFQEAVAAAEKNLGQYPADPELTSLLEAARRGLSEQFERAAVARALEASANFEKRGLLDQALREVQGTLDRHPNVGELAAAVARLRTRIAEETARRKKEELAQAFEAALKASNWNAAGARLEAAKRDFPGEARWEEFDQRLQASIRNAKFAELDKQVRTSLERKDFQAAGQALDAARNEFASDPAWTALAEETARRKKEDLVQAFEAALKASNWTAASVSLEAAKRAFPGDARWEEFDQRLRTSVRNAKFAELDKQVRTSLDRKDFQAANQALEVAREEFSNDPAWTALAEETARRKKEDLVQAFEAALKASNWTAASTSLEAAKRDFPGDARWEEFDQRLRASVRNAKFAELDKQVRTSLDRKDFQAANQALEVAREEFSNDPAWTALAEETVRRRKEDLVQAFEAAVKASNWSAASTSLEAAKRDFPGEVRWEEFDQRLRASVRNAKFAELDKQVRTSLDRKDFQAAAQALDAARDEFASDPAWTALAQETAIQAFETALKEANWTAAAARLDTARRDFPGDPRWEEFDKRIRTAKLAELDKQVRTSLERKDFQAAGQALDARKEFANDPAWTALKQDLDRRRDYEAGLEEARRARQDKQYDAAEAKLQTLITAGPVDGRAQAALDELRAERYWPQWLDEAVAQRREARRLSSSGDSPGAARLLEAFKKRFALYAEELFRQAAGKEAEAYTAVLAKAEKLRAASDYLVAEKLLREAIEIETGEPDGRARQLLAAIVQQRQQAEAIAAGLAQAAELRAKKDLTGALAVIDQLLRQHPQHAALTRDRSITMALLEEVWRREYAASLEEATKAEAGGDFAGARQILEKLVARNPPDDRARRALASVAQELDRQHREQAIATGRAEAALLKAGGDLVGALAILEKLLERYPDSPETRQELEKVRQQLAAQQARAEAIAKGRAEAARLRAKDPVAAAQILDALLHQYPGSPELLQDRAATEQAIQAARARDYEAALRDAEKARSKGALEAAQEILRRVISQGPLDARAEQALTRINQDLERKQHEETLSQGRREAARLLQKLDFPAAIALLGKLLQSHPESKELAADLAAARVADERAQRTRAYEQGLEEASQARSAERYDQAEELLRKLIEAGAPDNRARDTLKAIRSEQSRKIAAAQRQAQKQAPQPQRKPEVISIAVHPPPATEPKKGLPIPAIAGGGALILIIGLWLAFRGGKPVTHVDLTPSELSFNTRAGADGADAQEVTFGKVNEGLDRLDLQPSEPWITAEVREQSEGREHVAVQVRPKGLAAGSYSGNLRIAFRGGNIPAETVAVRLVVAPAAGSVGNTGNTGSTGGGAAVALQAAPASLDFQYKDGDPQPGPKKIIVQGGNFHAESGAAWLAVRASGNTVTAAVNPQNMLVGLHTASLYLRPDKGALIAVPVRLTIAAAQEFTSGAEAPIEILRWRGSLEPGATLTIQGSTASIGELAAGELPGSPIKLVSVGRPGQTNPAQPEPLRVTAPSQANGYSLKVQNAGTEAETSLIIRFRPGR